MDVRDDSGSLSTYLAAGLVLPLLAMLAGAGIALSGLATTAANLNDARDAGVVGAEIQGGLTPAVVSQVDTTLESLGVNPASATVSGTPAPVPWGSPIQLTVTASVPLAGFPWNAMGLAGRSVIVGGTTYTTSNLLP
jgi:hypothetical protein